MKEFFKSLFSLDEERNSILILILVATTALGLWKTFRYGDYPPQLFALTVTLTTTVAGLNVAKGFMKKDGE